MTYDPANAPSQIAPVHPNIVHSAAASSSLACSSQTRSLRAYGAAELVACRLMKHCAAISKTSLVFSLTAPVDMPNADPSRATARGACSDECCGSRAHIRPPLRHIMDVLVSLLLALSICNLRCGAMQSNPIRSDPQVTGNDSLETQQPTVFMRTSNPGSHPQSAQPRPGTAREHLPRSLPPRASPLPP